MSRSLGRLYPRQKGLPGCPPAPNQWHIQENNANNFFEIFCQLPVAFQDDSIMTFFGHIRTHTLRAFLCHLDATKAVCIGSELIVATWQRRKDCFPLPAARTHFCPTALIEHHYISLKGAVYLASCFMTLFFHCGHKT